MSCDVLEAIASALNERESAQGSRVLVIGVAYKKDVDDLRESPALKIMQLLIERGARIEYNGCFFPELHKMRRYDFEEMRSVDLTPTNLAAIPLGSSAFTGSKVGQGLLGQLYGVGLCTWPVSVLLASYYPLPSVPRVSVYAQIGKTLFNQGR